MKPTPVILGLLFLALGQSAESASSDAGKQKTDGSKGITVEDLGRGLKSAAQNVGKEIPKLGSAIGHAFKQITEKSSSNKSAQEGSKEK